jgi:NAD(P)H dehydrogenase (quinone)
MIAITGATGHLGRLVIAALLDQNVPASEIVAIVRDAGKAADLAARGVQVRQADYAQPDTLTAALRGVDKLLFVSSSEVGSRAAQHRNVVDAARATGVTLLAYTSIPKADTSPMVLAAEHKATEEMIRAAGLPFVFLRNGWYMENYTDNLAPTLQHGALLGSAGEGRFTPATRADYAAAAAAVLTGQGHENGVYELGGDESVSLAGLAAEIGTQSGTPVTYRNLPAVEYANVLTGFGLPVGLATVLADADLGIARGDLTTESGDLRRLIGRPTTTLADAVRAGLSAALATAVGQSSHERAPENGK